MRIESGKLTVQRYVKKRFLHRRVRQAEPLLDKVNAQHRLQGKWWPAGTALGVIRRDKRYQRSPGNDALHLLQELTLAGSLQAQIKVQGWLLHALYFLRLACHQAHKRASYAEFP